MSSKLREIDHGLNKLLKHLEKVRDLRVKVGIQGNRADKLHPDSELKNVEIGAVHEFGAPSVNIPARPFIRPAYDNDVKHWNDQLREQLARCVKDRADPRKALLVVGEELRTAMIDRMTAGIPPPLSEATIAKRRGNGTDVTPLLNTGVLRGSITVAIKKP